MFNIAFSGLGIETMCCFAYLSSCDDGSRPRLESSGSRFFLEIGIGRDLVKCRERSQLMTALPEKTFWQIETCV